LHDYAWYLQYLKGMGPIGMLALLAASTNDYQASIETWRRQYEEGLRAPYGWLSVAGLFWLHDGANRAGSDPQSDIVLPASAPRFAATLDFHAGATRITPARGVQILVNGKPSTGQVLQPDTAEHPDVVTLGSLTIAVIQRGSRTGVRLRDPESAARREFSGLHWFPIDERYRIRARWHAYNPPHKISITNVLGMTEDDTTPGYAEFEFGGKTWRLEPTVEDNELFFTFRDQTAGKETYPSGRFLKSAMPANGEVIIDFNKAYNPPCAFTAFATCPLPPRQNTIGAAINAGGKKYGH
jgi:uncharacterized protein (DUF1684 family)